jgi:phytoene desaturase
MVKLDPQYRLVFGGGGELVASPDLARLKSAVAGIAPADAAAIDRFMAENRRKLALFKPCLETPFLSLADVLTARMMKLLPMLRPWNSLDRELKRYFRDPRVRLAFSFQAKYLGMSPYKCPSLFSILSFLEYEHGVFHPIGGCNAVPRKMAAIAEEMGVTFHLGEPIERIVFQGRRAVGVETLGGRHDADAVVINGDFSAVIGKLIPPLLRARWSDRRIATSKYSCSTFMLYLGVRGLSRQPNHNIYLAEDYTQNLADIEQHHALSADPSIYVQNASVTDPSLAPRDCSTLYVLAPVTHQHANVDWKKQSSDFRKTVLAQLPKLGFEDVENRIVFEKCITPDDWARLGPLYRGATFSLAHNLGQMLHRRPHNRFDGVERVYLVGGGTHPGSGLPVIFESARISTQLLLEDLGLRAHAAMAPAEPVLVGDAEGTATA